MEQFFQSLINLSYAINKEVMLDEQYGRGKGNRKSGGWGMRLWPKSPGKKTTIYAPICSTVWRKNAVWPAARSKTTICPTAWRKNMAATIRCVIREKIRGLLRGNICP